MHSSEKTGTKMTCRFDGLDGMIITEDTTVHTFAGLESKRVIISFKDKEDTFSVYYTNDIDLLHPNRTNPYHKINGVLTNFRLTMGPYLMEFKATKFDHLKENLPLTKNAHS